MSREELINFGEMYLEVNEDSKNTNTYEFVEEALKLFKQESCEKAVSVQAVLAIAKEDCETAIIPYRRFVKDINALPPVMPTRKKGNWIMNKEGDTICCPFCNDKQKITKGEAELLKTAFARFNFCIYCGAEMEGVVQNGF